MASERAKNFLRGFIATQPGISRAYIENLIMEDERKQAEKEEARQARMDKLYERNVLSQIAAREPEEPVEPSIPKFSFETPEGLKISGEANENMKKIMEQYQIKKPETKEEKPPMGSITVEDVIKSRKSAHSKAREDALKTLSKAAIDIETFEPLNVGKTPEAVKEAIAEQLRKGEALKLLNKLSDEQKPILDFMWQAFNNYGDFPQEYQDRPGSALIDSVDRANKGDIGIMSELLDYKPGGKEDPEIAKARKKLESGEWDQAKFDRFMEWYNAENR